MIPVAASHSSPTQHLGGIVPALLLSLVQSVHAQPNPDMIESDKKFLSSPDKEWSESEQIEFPDVPRQTELVPLDSESVDERYEYFIDPASVSVGSDKVARYSVVLESKSGVRNIFYEGIRCATSEFKTYAYATQTGRFKPLASPFWRKLKTTRPHDYRRLLAERYVCDRDGWALDEKQVQERISKNNFARPRYRSKPGYSENFGH